MTNLKNYIVEYTKEDGFSGHGVLIATNLTEAMKLMAERYPDYTVTAMRETTTQVL